MNEINGLHGATSALRVPRFTFLPTSVTQGDTRAVTQSTERRLSLSLPEPITAAPRTRKRNGGSSPRGIGLLLRGRTFYFRKRISSHLTGETNRHLCISLQTHLPSEAMVRAAALLAALDRTEARLMERCDYSPAELKLLFTEMARRELQRFQRAIDVLPQDPASIDLRIEAIEGELANLKTARRHRDFSIVEPALADAASSLNIPVQTPLSGSSGRGALDLKEALLLAEKSIEEGESLEGATKQIIATYDLGSAEKALIAPTMLSEVCDRYLARQTTDDMKNHVRAFIRALIAIHGDCPVDSFTPKHADRFLVTFARLPRDHARRNHGNRHQPMEYEARHLQAIAEADDQDALAVRKHDHLRETSEIAYRSAVSDELIPRMTEASVEKARARLVAMFRFAKREGLYSGTDVLLTTPLSQIMAEATRASVIDLHKAIAKKREQWSAIKQCMLFLCSVFTGHSSEFRRWKRGAQIIRDAIYWVPLILVSMGSRIKEIAELTKADIIVVGAPGVVCLRLNQLVEDQGKTEWSKRNTPIPLFLLKLGFVEWAMSQPGDASAPLFPEIFRGTDDDIGNFQKRLRTIFENLGLLSSENDLYALRRTLLSKLSHLDVGEDKIARIAGHAPKTITAAHYLDGDMQQLKSILDLADFGLNVGISPEHGFPIIADCTIDLPEEVSLEATLDTSGAVSSLSVSVVDGAEVVTNREKIARSDFANESAFLCAIHERLHDVIVHDTEDDTSKAAISATQLLAKVEYDKVYSRPPTSRHVRAQETAGRRPVLPVSVELLPDGELQSIVVETGGKLLRAQLGPAEKRAPMKKRSMILKARLVRAASGGVLSLPMDPQQKSAILDIIAA